MILDINVIAVRARGGSGLCPHNKRKYDCKECGGNAFLAHGKKKSTSRCKDYNGCKLYKGPRCETSGNTRHKGHCVLCFIHLYPGEPTARNYEMKTSAATTDLSGKFPDVEWMQDKRVGSGCSKRKPGLLLDMGSYIVIIDVDDKRKIVFTMKQQ